MSITTHTPYSVPSSPAALGFARPFVDLQHASRIDSRSSIAPPPNAETASSGAPRAAGASRAWRQSRLEVDSDDEQMDDEGDVQVEDDKWHSDQDSEETHESIASSRDSAVLMTPPVMAPRLLSDLLSTGPKRKRSLTHLSSIPIDFIQAESASSRVQSPSLRASRPIKGRKRVSFMLPPPLEPSSPVPAEAKSISAATRPPEGSGQGRAERRPVGLSGLMRRMSVDADRCMGIDEAAGAGSEQTITAEESGKGSEDSEYDSDDSDEDDDLIIII